MAKRASGKTGGNGSTGVYWQPVWNILELLMLLNPALVRAMQGHKSDRIDARHIAEYLQPGMLYGSFIPPKDIRQLRELTRMRVHIQQDRIRVERMADKALGQLRFKLPKLILALDGRPGRTKDCLLSALFYRVAQRHGMKKAAIAVAHRILKIAYKLISRRRRLPGMRRRPLRSTQPGTYGQKANQATGGNRPYGIAGPQIGRSDSFRLRCSSRGLRPL